MRVAADFSHKMTCLAVLATISVVYIHSTAYLTMQNPARWNVFVETLITRSFTRWAVPFFFAASGFWFGRSEYVSAKIPYHALLASKANSLLIPYVCWCCIGFVLSLPLIVGNNIIAGNAFFDRTVFSVAGIWGKLDAFFGITSVGPQANMPLWFVRSLMLLFLFAPIWRKMLLLPFGVGLLTVGAVLCLVVCPIGIPCLQLPSEAVSWFAIGMVVSRYEIEALSISRSVMMAAGIVYVAASAGVAAMTAGWFALKYVSGCVYLFNNFLIPVCGMVFVWAVYDMVDALRLLEIPLWMRQTFFIYCVHEIVCGYMISATRFWFGKTDMVTCLCTLWVPVAAYFCSGFVLAMFVRRVSPRFYAVISGGR